MNASQGREPARPQQGNGAGGAKNTSAAAQPRLSREAVVAFVLLPVLLAAGFFLGGRLLGEDSPGTIDAADVDATQDADPGAPGTDVEPSVDPAATPTEVPPVVGPPAPTEDAAAPSAEPTQAPSPEPSPEPTQVPSPEPTQEPTQAPSAEPTQEPTQAPSPEPTQEPAPTQPPAPEPTEPTEPTEPAVQPQGEPNLQTVVQGIPQPTAGDGVLLFRGVANEDVRAWQARMVERGWDLTVDGIYGERSSQVAQAFQIEKGLVVDGLVGPETWSAAWTTPIT